MNYEKIYSRLIKNRLENPATGVVERHHIIPRCLGGDDKQDNLVYLTPREHFICHYLLAKIHGGSLWSAYYFMSQPNSNSGKGVRVTSTQYEIARKNYVSYLKTKTGNKNPNFGNSYSKEARLKISQTRKRYQKRKHPRAKNCRLEWRHKSGEIFFGSHFDLSDTTGLPIEPLRRVASGGLYSYKGWTCPSSGREDMRSGENTNTADKNIYIWVSPQGDKIKGTRSFMRENYGLNQNGTSNLVRGVIKKHKGWSICL